MAEQIPAADIRPGMVVELTIRARVTGTFAEWYGPVRLDLMESGEATMSRGEPARHSITLAHDVEVTVHDR